MKTRHLLRRTRGLLDICKIIKEGSWCNREENTSVNFDLKFVICNYNDIDQNILLRNYDKF